MLIFIFLLLHAVAETSSPYSGVVGLGPAVDGSSPGLPLALPAEPGSQPASHTGSPDPAALTVLQPSNGASQHYTTMLPNFGYSTTGNERYMLMRTTIIPQNNSLICPRVMIQTIFRSPVKGNIYDVSDVEIHSPLHSIYI